MSFDDMVDAIGDLPLTVSRVCPVCQGNGTMWLRESEGDAMPFGTEVQCWHCSGSCWNESNEPVICPKDK